MSAPCLVSADWRRTPLCTFERCLIERTLIQGSVGAHTVTLLVFWCLVIAGCAMHSGATLLCAPPAPSAGMLVDCRDSSCSRHFWCAFWQLCLSVVAFCTTRARPASTNPIVAAVTYFIQAGFGSLTTGTGAAAGDRCWASEAQGLAGMAFACLSHQCRKHPHAACRAGGFSSHGPGPYSCSLHTQCLRCKPCPGLQAFGIALPSPSGVLASHAV